VKDSLVIVVMALSAGGIGACAPDGPDGTAASASFAVPADGDRVAGGVAVDMLADHIKIEKAGDVHVRAGHFHVIADARCVDPGDAIVEDVDHVHFGKGQTTGTVYLGPGTHELCLQVGDGVHEALDVTDTVTVEVGVTDQDEWCAVVAEVDRAAADAALAPLFESMSESEGMPVAEAWILDACGVAIDD
jgi:hypothetical protein